MTTKREVVRMAFEGKAPPYVPWNFSLTAEATDKARLHYGDQDLADVFQNHYCGVGANELYTPIGDGRVRDLFGVVWDRSIDKDIGVVTGAAFAEPTLKGYEFPDPVGSPVFQRIPDVFRDRGDHFRVFQLGFSLYERAWTLRGGLDHFMMDFYEHPEFARELLNTIADWNIAQLREGTKHEFDCVHFGDDWGQQRGLQMGYGLWREFIYPALKRMYKAAHDAGCFVSTHSCGDVQELFDDLINIGLNCFNPFQPEVMDVAKLMARYEGRLAFHGGMSTQRTLPYGTPDDVRRETNWLLDLGKDGGYIFSPAHAVEGDVPVENIVAFIDAVQSQPGYTGLA